MGIKFDKLFSLMKKRGLSTYRIRQENILPQGTLTSLKNNKSVTTETISKLCKALNCQPGDIMEYVDEQNETIDNSD